MYIYIILALAAVALDQISKILITSKLALSQTEEFIPGFISFTYIRNEGAAFGMLEGARVFFIILTIVVLALLILYVKKARPQSKLEKLALCFITGGAIGNFIDRIYFGYVRDFIRTDFMDFPVFNIADCFVCIGAGLYILYSVMDLFKQKKEDLNHESESA